MSKLKDLTDRYAITRGKRFKLKDFDPSDTGPYKTKDKEQAPELLARGVRRMAELQDMLYAQDRWSLLLIFQAMDAAGKDGTIKHVMSGVNPQSCHVSSFKAPSNEELDHDFMWRTSKALPERGRIGIFNRSYYEEVLVVRVHPEYLAKEKMPLKVVHKKRIWKERFEDINAFERYLARNGTVIRKFFLHVSKDEQEKRFLERLDKPEKNWKFSAADVREREHWDDYMDAYEDMIRHTSSEHAPWFVVPADHKWYTRLVVSEAIVDALESMKLAYPKLDAEQKKGLEVARKMLLQGKERSAKR
jgi:PPK2 family polyphosphate:nucleotide phosphotransferase